MTELDNNFLKSTKKLLDATLFSANHMLIFMVIGIIFQLLIFFTTRSILLLDFFIMMIIMNNIVFLPFIFEKHINKRSINSQFGRTMKYINVVTEIFAELNFFYNNNEKGVFKNNLKSLETFKLVKDYKYCMIAMGSILEFLLVRYCKDQSIRPEVFIRDDRTTQSGNKFSNYIQAAIKHDLFGQKKSWYIVQNNLRSFRNYVHISKENKEEKIDKGWYQAIVPIFDKLILTIGRNNQI
jgi:hypothetical protein